MIFKCSLAALMLALSGLEAVVVLTQEKSLTASPGSNVKISCISSKSNWELSWYQKKPGSSPRFLAFDSIRASDLPSRFRYSRTDNNIYLHINGVTAEDEAVYYCGCADCGADHSDALYRTAHKTFGGGTKLNILTRPSSPPTLALLPPSPEELSAGEATLVCLAQGFYPDSLSVSWTAGESAVAESEVQTGEARRGADGTYSTSSLLTVPAAQWSSGRSFSCRLTHPALSAPLSRAVTHADCGS